MPGVAWLLSIVGRGQYSSVVPKSSRAAVAPRGDDRPGWLQDAPADLRLILEVGFEKFGDDPPAIATWLGRLHDYKQFWSIVEADAADLEQRYQHDAALQEQVAEGRAHPEHRVPRPTRRTA